MPDNDVPDNDVPHIDVPHIDVPGDDTPDTEALDRDIATLQASAPGWVSSPLGDKRRLLERVRAATLAAADDWVTASCLAKGTDASSPAAGEEWLSGPYAVLNHVRSLITVLRQLEAGRNPLDRCRSRTLPSSQVALRVLPYDARDILLVGYTADVWLRNGVSLEQAKAGVARALRDPMRPPEIGLVLGGGNINSIPPLDTLTKLFQDNAVVMLKLNPVNAYLEPILARALAPLCELGIVRITSGGADTGRYLVRHPGIDSLHITGSAASHDTIVFGHGLDGARRKAARRPLTRKPITSELGGICPVIVVPGRWSESTMRHQARHLATQRLHNSGFNCIATQIVVIPERWAQADRFLDHLRRAVREAPLRPGYYPGAASRQHAAARSHPDAEMLGGDPAVPRTLLASLDATDRDEPAFRDEYFGPVLGVTRLPGTTPASYLDAAVDFCNQRLLGDLGVGLIAAPRTIRDLGGYLGGGPAGRLDAAIARLRYGNIGLNCWVGMVYGVARATWGACPGHDSYDVGSGVGVVHNALLLDPDHVERSVGRGPFRPRPMPPWFVQNRSAHRTGEHMTRYAGSSSVAGPLEARAVLSSAVQA